jgi:hypothetical protein
MGIDLGGPQRTFLTLQLGASAPVLLHRRSVGMIRFQLTVEPFRMIRSTKPRIRSNTTTGMLPGAYSWKRVEWASRQQEFKGVARLGFNMTIVRSLGLVTPTGNQLAWRLQPRQVLVLTSPPVLCTVVQQENPATPAQVPYSGSLLCIVLPFFHTPYLP